MLTRILPIIKVKYWVSWEIICDYISVFCWLQLTISHRFFGKTDLDFSCFLCQAICTQRTPEETQVIVGSMNMGYISDTTRNRTHNLFRPKREPIPLGHSDGPKVEYFEVFGEAVYNFILVFCWQYLYFTPFSRFSTSKISVKWPWLSKVTESWLFQTFYRDHMWLSISFLMTSNSNCTVLRYFNPCRKLSIPDSLNRMWRSTWEYSSRYGITKFSIPTPNYNSQLRGFHIYLYGRFTWYWRTKGLTTKLSSRR